MKDMFEENDTHPTPVIGTRDVKFENDQEIDASKINFSNPEILEFVSKSLKEMGFLQ